MLSGQRAPFLDGMRSEMGKELVPQNNELIIYTSAEGDVRVEVLFQDDTFWMNINRIAELFGTTKQVVSYHLQNIYETGELKREATVKEILTVRTEGKRQVSRNLDFFSLDAIIAVGYRVNSYQATQFRIWATAQDWVKKLDAFLKFNEYEVLEDAGRVSHEVAASLAGKEYEKFRVTQDREYIGDFEKEVNKITSKQSRGKGKAD